MAIIFANAPTASLYTNGGYDKETETYTPVSLQYGEYVADSDAVRKVSIAGDVIEAAQDENVNPYEQTTDPYAANTDPYAESTDPYAESTDPYAESTDPYAESTDPYAESTDPYAESTDPYAESTDPYEQTTEVAEESNVIENRSYYGQTAERQKTATDLDAILYAAENVPEEAKVIVCMGAKGPMIMSEFESQVDAILMNFEWGMFDYDFNNALMLDVIAGKVEPTGLLPVQMPANMETVEAQLEDVPRDMECYVDSEGNTYDFAYGLNWSGVINDERTEKYNVEALTKAENISLQ